MNRAFKGLWDVKMVVIKATLTRLFTLVLEARLKAVGDASVDWAECVLEGDPENLNQEIGFEDLQFSPANLDDIKTNVQDLLEEVDNGG